MVTYNWGFTGVITLTTQGYFSPHSKLPRRPERTDQEMLTFPRRPFWPRCRRGKESPNKKRGEMVMPSAKCMRKGWVMFYFFFRGRGGKSTNLEFEFLIWVKFWAGDSTNGMKVSKSDIIQTNTCTLNISKLSSFSTRKTEMKKLDVVSSKHQPNLNY